MFQQVLILQADFVLVFWLKSILVNIDLRGLLRLEVFFPHDLYRKASFQISQSHVFYFLMDWK